MVAFKAGRGERVCAQPPDNIRAILVYGPNNGLVRERAKTAVTFAVEDLKDSFRLCEVDARDVSDDAARLADELAAFSFGGGRRAVWLKGAGDSLSDNISAALDIDFGNTLFVIECANLKPRSALRKLFDKESDLAAVPCYEDDDNTLRDYISDFLASENTAIDQDALAWLLGRLGNDRLQVRSELEKLILYCSDSGEGAEGKQTKITIEAVTACSADAGQQSLDSLADAVASGELANIDRYLELAFDQGIQPIGAIRSVTRRFTQLHFVVGLTEDGGSTEQLIASLRPPIFFKYRRAFQMQTALWPLRRIVQALDILTKAEIDCKTTGMPSTEICARALTRIGGAARTKKGRR